MRKGIGMATESGRAVLLTRCLQLNALALAFSLAHVVADWHIGLFGASFVFTPLTEYVADVIHFGSLIFGVWGAYATWRVRRTSRVAGRPADAHA